MTHLRAYRRLLLVAGSLVPLFWVIYQFSNPHAVDPLWARVALSGIAFVGFGLSYVSDTLKQHLRTFLHGLIYLLTIWFLALTALNRFTPNYAVGLLFVVLACGVATGVGAKRSAPVAGYLLFASFATTVTALLTPAPQMSPPLLTGCVVGTALVIYVATRARIRARRERIVSEEHFRAAAEGSLDAFLLFDIRRGDDGQIRELEVIDMNTRAADLMDCSRIAALGQPLRTLLPLYQSSPIFARLADAADTGEPLEEEFAAPDGERWFQHQVVSIDDGLALTLRDITERKQNEMETARLKNFYEQVMESLAADIAVFDRKKRFVYVNEHAVSDPEMREWLIGRTELDYCRRRGRDPSLARQRTEHMERVFQTGEKARFEETLSTDDGPRHFVREMYPITDLQGRVIQVLGYGLDITERKEAEKALRASERRYRRLMNAANDAIFVAEAETGQLVDANKKAQELTGRSLDEIRQMHQCELYPPEKRDEHHKLFQQHVQEDTAVTDDVYVVDKAGNQTPVDISSSVVKVDDRELIQAIFRDATARKRHEEQLIAAKEQAEEMLRLKSDILNNMSHEVRTPLTGILGFAEVLREKVNGENYEFAELITQNARRLQKTLNSVLDMARLERGEMTVQAEPVKVAEEVREAASLFRPQAERKGLTLLLDVSAPEARAYADDACLHRILNNLVDNAIKFTDEGHVTLAVGAEAEQIHVQVRDTGTGISEDFLPHLFDEFRQQSRGLDRSHEGSGLGLAITRRLVELMNGEIAVESEKGVGTTFTVSLPRAHPAEGEQNSAPDSASSFPVA